ncbi:relaxase/mobilization nuclease domain-containing protein, partial [Anaerovorax odorimutans]|uniref:relaxase/mobilization nuclease domain-containing protein n=1 Tax=Anaerovorax odorimutans TaxID=109327 RepID=UPI00210B5C85
MHNHFVLNTVSFVNGLRYHRTAADYRAMRQMSDALCREYGLSVIESPRNGKGKQYGEWRAEQEGRPTWRGLIKADVDEAIEQ